MKLENMKQELIKKIKEVLQEHNNMLMPDVEISLGDVYTITYNEECDSVEVDVIAGSGQSVVNPETVTVEATFIPEADLERILERLINE